MIPTTPILAALGTFIILIIIGYLTQPPWMSRVNTQTQKMTLSWPLLILYSLTFSSIILLIGFSLQMKKTPYNSGGPAPSMGMAYKA